MIAAERVRLDLGRCPFGFDSSSPMLDLHFLENLLLIDALIDLLIDRLIASLEEQALLGF